MDGGHQAFLDAEGVLEDLGHRGQAVGGAGGVGNEVHALVIGCVVHAHDEHRGIVLGRGGEKDLFGPAGQVPLHFFRGGEFSGALHDVLCPHRGPGNLVGLLTVEHPDPAAVHDEVVPLPAHLALEAAVDAVIF